MSASLARLPKESLMDPEARARLTAALLSRAKDQDVTVRQYGRTIPGRAYYDSTKRSIGVGESGTDYEPSLLAHELGHAEFDQGTLGALIQHPISRAAATAATPIGFLIGAVAEGSLARRMALSGGVAAAMQLPLLTGEAVASIKGHRFLKEEGAPQEILDLHKKEMLRGFGTYLAPGARALTGAALGTLAF